MTPDLTAIPGLLFIALSYAALCALSPFGNCRNCRGLGFQLTTTRRGKLKRGKHCRRCEGHGKRLRAGRWIYNHAARIHRDGTR
ncbi:hypothetical protein [Streptomyces nanshensis]|uniref:Uncharacterized protein n=1 Tax=Streptomyces nanshensis TaxID=518642 RepID=A0A1E7L2T4_9ACTN|nr:hypothetical protein [Streptomyces nanshensis]OEV10507.1 hypothetical protein AN218_17290 [Streptomyces nanshensis]